MDEDFAHRLPKVEVLHAHLTGSISPHILHELWLARKADDLNMALRDPLEVMSTEKEHFNIFTFFPLFDSYIYSLVDTIHGIRYCTGKVLEGFRHDGVRYLELRTTPRAIPQQGISKEMYVTTVLECAADFCRVNSEAISVNLILSIDRKNTVAEAMETVDLALSLRSRGHERIVGVDLCGNPARGKDSIPLFKPAFAKARDAGLKITLHFAEIPASSSDEELQTLLSLDPDRLGHVIHVPEQVKKEIARRQLGLELCLSCNVLGQLTNGGFAAHHFGEWRHTGCPIALSTDDVGVFGSPLSKEYLLASQHFGLSRQDLVDLIRGATSVIFGAQHEKDRMTSLLNEIEASIN